MRALVRYTVAFIMPTKYTMATLPKPENPNVQVRPCHRWHGPAPMPVDCAGQDMTLHLWVLPWTLTLTPASTLAAPNGRLRACRSRRCLHKPSRRSRGGALTASLASCPPLALQPGRLHSANIEQALWTVLREAGAHACVNDFVHGVWERQPTASDGAWQPCARSCTRCAALIRTVLV